jgi:hypothetical protein
MIIRIKIAVPMPMYIVQFSLGFLYKAKYDGSDSTHLPYGEGEPALIPEINRNPLTERRHDDPDGDPAKPSTKSQLEELLIILLQSSL